MNQAQRASAAAHHVPVGIGQSAAVDLFEQGLGCGGAAWPAQGCLKPEAMHQLLEQLRLLRQGGALPEAIGEVFER